MKTSLRGRTLVKGFAQGEALVTHQPISFLGGIDPDTGLIVEKEHELRGSCITNKIFVFPYGKGSTVGTYVMFSMAKKGTKPAGIINRKTEPIIAAGCILGEIPLMDDFEKDPIEAISNGDHVIMDDVQQQIVIRRSKPTSIVNRTG